MIETERLRLRPFEADDFPALYAIEANPEVNRYMGGPPPPRDEYLARVPGRWAAYYEANGFGLWATLRKPDGLLLGRCGLLRQEVDGVPETEVAYGFDVPHWGRGYATEAARAVRDWGFRNTPAPHLISLVHVENAPSMRVAERNGMHVWKTSTFRGFPVVVYRIDRAAWEAAGGA